jgi:hypothetical protein
MQVVETAEVAGEFAVSFDALVGDFFAGGG